MKFLLVHSWDGFPLLEWYFRDSLTTINSKSGDLSFKSCILTPHNSESAVAFRNLISIWKPDIIGFSCHFWSIECYIEAASWAYLLDPGVKTVFGGPQVNSVASADDLLTRFNQIDFIIRGPGEKPLKMLIESDLYRHDYEGIDGLSYRSENGISHNETGHTGVWNRNIIFHPGNTGLISAIDGQFIMTYETLRGCYNSCHYCQYTGSEYAVLDIEIVKQELRFILSFSFPNLKICDSHFGGTADRAKEILEVIAKYNSNNTSVKIYPDLSHIDDEYISLIKNANAQITSIGIQSTNPAALDKINRKNNIRNSNAIKKILENFPETPADLIIGLPGDSANGLKQSFSDVLSIGFTHVNTFPMTVFPGTGLSNNVSYYFGTNEFNHTNGWQIISSPGFPLHTHRDTAGMINALHLSRFMKRTQNAVGGNAELFNIIHDIEPVIIEQIREIVTSHSPVVFLQNIKKVIHYFNDVTKNRAEVIDAIVYDLLHISFKRAARSHRQEFNWYDDCNISLIRYIYIKLFSSYYIFWNMPSRQFSLYPQELINFNESNALVLNLQTLIAPGESCKNEYSAN